MEAEIVSNCCGSDMIHPDWDEVEEAGSMWRAYACYICKKCGEVCKPVNPAEFSFKRKLVMEVEILGLENWDLSWSDKTVREMEVRKLEDDIRSLFHTVGYGSPSEIKVKCEIK